MATLIPNPFPLLDTPDMIRPGRKTEFEVYKNLGNLYDENCYIIYGPQHIRINKKKAIKRW